MTNLKSSSSAAPQQAEQDRRQQERVAQATRVVVQAYREALERLADA